MSWCLTRHHDISNHHIGGRVRQIIFSTCITNYSCSVNDIERGWSPFGSFIFSRIIISLWCHVQKYSSLAFCESSSWTNTKSYLVGAFFFVIMSRRSEPKFTSKHVPISMVSCQNGPTCHAYAWQIGPFWQDTLDFFIRGTLQWVLNEFVIYLVTMLLQDLTVPVFISMMMSSNGNIFRVTGLLCGEYTGHSLTKASDAELWCFLWYLPE